MEPRDRAGRGAGARALIAVAVGALAVLLLAPSGALAAKKKLSVKVASSSQTQVSNQGALKVSFKAKGLSKVTASATATPDGGSPVDFASQASKNNPKSGTLSLPLTADGQAAVDDCASLSVKVKASGSGKKANASAVLAEDDPECAKPVKEFSTETSASYPTGITVGPDDALWFAQSGAGENSLGRMTTDGDYSMFHIPVPDGSAPDGANGHGINDVVAGPDGGIWATPMVGELSFGANLPRVRRFDPGTEDVSESDPTVAGVNLSNTSGEKITVGPDGALWMTGTNELIRITTGGDVSSFPLADPNFPDITVHPYAIATGGDGALWFTSNPYFDDQPATIGRFDPATEETTLFPLAEPTDKLGLMTADVAGRLWFINVTGNKIGRIDPMAPEPQIVQFAIPTADSRPAGIAFAGDGSLWFTEQNPDNIGRYDPASGLFTEYPLETQGSMPFDITVGPDGKIYFTETGTGKIGQLDPNKAPVGPPNTSDGSSQPPFGDTGRCDVPTFFLCQQQVNLSGSTFDIGTALHQELPPETLTLTAGVDLASANILAPPAFGPMLEAKPLDVVVAGTPATTKIGLSGPPRLTSLFPVGSVVPIDLFVSQPGNPAGGCVIGPVVQDLFGVDDEEGDLGTGLAYDPLLVAGFDVGHVTAVWTGTLEDTSFEVPEARGCGALTDIINNVLSLPSAPGNNATRLPFSLLILYGPAAAG
jgi:virginiamycin B lyase